MKKLATVVATTVLSLFGFLSNDAQACGPVRNAVRHVAQNTAQRIQNTAAVVRTVAHNTAVRLTPPVRVSMSVVSQTAPQEMAAVPSTPGQVGVQQSGRAVVTFPKVRFGPYLGSTCPGGVCPSK